MQDGNNKWQMGIDEGLKTQTDAKYHPENLKTLAAMASG